jgi:deazaflavin-dependent oxidoreductase (nitroreductase family)
MRRSMSGDTINGIPRVDPYARAAWKRTISWWLGGRLGTTKTGAAVWRRIGAPLEAPIMKATGGRMRLNFAAPVVVLTSTGRHSGERRETPLTYFTDRDDVILTVSHYGRRRNPSWYYNLIANPECELYIGPRGGRFVARETEGDDRDRLFALAVELFRGYAKYAQRTSSIRTIPMLRLTPVR